MKVRKVFYRNKFGVSASIQLQCEVVECTICKRIKFFLEAEGEDKTMRALAQHNLDQHLKTGKHWREIQYIPKVESSEKGR